MAESRLAQGLAFVALVVVCATLIAGTAALTRGRIEENRLRQFQRTLTELAGSARAAADVRWSADDVALLCDGRSLLRGRAAGYGGTIEWIAAADLTGPAPHLVRLRVTAHQETPGIADFLDRPDSGWLGALGGSSAAALATVDTVSGATITSRALLRSLSAALQRPALADPACPA
ncbi:MAG: FMN-binding protein [Pseudomonadales bacterium]